MTDRNKATALRFIEAFSSGDSETAAACLASDAQTVAKGFGKLSGVRPRELILPRQLRFATPYRPASIPDFRSVTAEGDTVVVEFTGRSTLANGEEYNNEYCMVFTFGKGLITRVNEYYCTILADEKILPLLAEVEASRQA